jgi:lambda repressor-like predicted transcriptional regulator
MIIAVSTDEQKREKAKMARLLKKYRIKMIDITEKSGLHYNSVRNALNHEYKYWNQSVMNLAESMIEEKKSALITTK